MPDFIELVEIPCPLCGSRDRKFFLETIDYAHGIGGKFRLVRCKVCGHVYMNPAPTEESLAACYPSEYVPHRDQRSETAAATTTISAEGTNATGSARQPLHLSSFARAIPGLRTAYYWLTDNQSQSFPPVNPAGRRALEIGCATGEFLQRLQSAGWQAQGLELVEGPVQVARQRGFEVHHGQLASAAFPSEQFDDVFAWMVVEHIPDPVATLQEISRILKPGGWFCFSIPNFGGPERHIFRRFWRGYDLPRHLQHYTVPRIKSLLQEAGFETRQVIHQPSFLNWIGSAGLALERGLPWLPLGRMLNNWFWNNPPLWTYFVLGPFAQLQSALRLGGRLTILARKEPNTTS